ncbi:MAG: hypothetical protein GY913_09245 [Proteobacteria bacterium]|nr:hypothetical protein [Pseudomonadota bacterium]MCP4917097.1 hypothetical protein [Pseudomonadota bacterium]
MPLIWALFFGAAPHKHSLAGAVERYLAGDAEAVRELEALHAERPFDDDVAYWLAVAWIEAERCVEGVELLDGRTGRSQPAARLRAWEGLGRLCAGDEAEGLALLVAAHPEMPRMDPLAPRVATEIGVRVPVEQAGVWIQAAGGVVPGRLAFEAPLSSFTFRYAGETWRWDPTTRVALPGASALEPTCEPLELDDVVVRGHCGEAGVIWEVLREDQPRLAIVAADGSLQLLDLPVVGTHPTW